MKSTYLSYLNSLDKRELIRLLYTPFTKHGEYPAVSKRRVALRLSYDGTKFKGVQAHRNLRSVYDCLQNALEVTELGTKPVFCGRTDAGVSAIAMTVSVDVNSRLASPNRTYEIAESDYSEYPYDVILNMSLPEEVRVTGWAPVPDTFHARYSCIQRQYRYFFSLEGLDLKRMQLAVDQISELENFYDLSTHSNPKAVYERKIDEMTIEKVDLQGADVFRPAEQPADPNGLYCLSVKASGFLHNMVRKIFWSVQNYGRGNPLVLKNVEIADARPLVFVGAKYKDDLNFLGNRYSEIQFKEEAGAAKVKAAIAEVRYRQSQADSDTTYK